MKRLEKFEFSNCRVILEEIPVVAYDSVDKVCDLAAKHKVDAIIMVGESGSIKNQVSVELIGTNWLNTGIPDNAGQIYERTKSYETDHDGYFATTWPADMVQYIHDHSDIDCFLSLSAGDYICNHTLFGVLHKQKLPAGFIHVPAVDKDDEEARMIFDWAAKALSKAVEFVSQTVEKDYVVL